MSRLLCSLYWIEVGGGPWKYSTVDREDFMFTCISLYPQSVSARWAFIYYEKKPPSSSFPNQFYHVRQKVRKVHNNQKESRLLFFLFLFFHQIVPWNCCKDDTKEIEETTFLRAFDEQQTTVLAHSELSFLLCLDSYNNPFNFKYVRSPRTTFCDPFFNLKKKANILYTLICNPLSKSTPPFSLIRTDDIQCTSVTPCGCISSPSILTNSSQNPSSSVMLQK